MKNYVRLIVSTALIFAFFTNALPCGPSYVSPIFEYQHAPENPYANFAAGKIGILKPTQRRIVLIAAYRYLNGSAFSDTEQKALVEVWNAEFNNQPYEEDDIGETVKTWVAKRKAVVGSEAKPPEIYVEREYGGYDFFPNCTKNAFETATQTLNDRIASHGSEDNYVKDWVKAQDQVFSNCASGKTTPAPATDAMPVWLRKDRAYQLAAADFYSLDYESARRRFTEIAQDFDSPWQETAEYLVGRTLVRQASLLKDKTKANLLLTEAEQALSPVALKSGRFSDSATKMLGLIKYRLRPQERVRELAQTIGTQSSPNFRQDLIDYNWLLDKFEKETLEAEEKRKKEEAEKTAEKPDNRAITTTETNVDNSQQQPEGEMSINFTTGDSANITTFYVKPGATDEEVFAVAEGLNGKPLTEAQRTALRNERKSAYARFFESNRQSEYQGGYWGAEKMSLALMPDYLRLDELTNWLFTFQAAGTEAYLHALAQYRQTNSDLWLLTAFVKADKSSTELPRLFEASDKINRFSVVYPTIVHHKARILIDQGKSAEARKLLDEILDSNMDLPISTRNRFLAQRAPLSETLDDYLRFAQLKPFAFDWDGSSGTIDDFIKMQKSWYSPESYPNQTREEYDKEVEENFKNERVWENRTMFDAAMIDTMNQHFPLPVLVAAEKSPALPDYLRERFALSIWTRAVLFDDFTTAEKISPEIVKHHPDLKVLIDRVNLAKTPAGKQRAAYYLILKNPMFTPYLEDGFGKTDNEFNTWDGNDWWCAPYDTEYDDTQNREVPKRLPTKPAFLSAAQSKAAQDERTKLKAFGDAPKFLAERILEWQRLAPADKRIPEMLSIVFEANGWTKYGCGNNIELRQQIGDILIKKYPQSEFTKKVADEMKQEN